MTEVVAADLLAENFLGCVVALGQPDYGTDLRLAVDAEGKPVTGVLQSVAPAPTRSNDPWGGAVPSLMVTLVNEDSVITYRGLIPHTLPVKIVSRPDASLEDTVREHLRDWLEAEEYDPETAHTEATGMAARLMRIIDRHRPASFATEAGRHFAKGGPEPYEPVRLEPVALPTKEQMLNMLGGEKVDDD